MQAGVLGCSKKEQSRVGVSGSVTGLKQSRVDVRDQLNEGQLKLASCSYSATGERTRKENMHGHSWVERRPSTGPLLLAMIWACWFCCV